MDAIGRPTTVLTSTRATTPPGPKGLPLLGSVRDFRRDPLSFLTACAREHGDIVAYRIGPLQVRLLSGPEEIERVLVREHHDFPKMRFFWRQVSAVFGNGLLTSEGKLWQRQRRLAAPAFSGPRLTAYGQTMVQMTQAAIAGWQPGETRDLHADLMALTLGIAVKTLFGLELAEDVAQIDAAVADMSTEAVSRFARPVFIPDWVPLPGHLRYRRGLRLIDAIVARVIDERRAGAGEPDTLLAVLQDARDENGAAMSDRQLRDEVITFLLAGHDTTALTLSWTLHLLGRHPEIDARLGAHIDEILAGNSPTYADLPRLAYAEHVVTEAMRLFPPAWIIGREARRDCVIGGYPVRAGTGIAISPWVLHRDPRHFADPGEFRPERWQGDLMKRLPRFAFMPFGGGPRICIGNRFAMAEAVLILAVLIQRFRFVTDRDRHVVPIPSMTLRPQGGIPARLVSRHDRPA